MALTALQRDFLINNLGINPQRKTLDLGGKHTDSKLQHAVDAYLLAESQLLNQLTTVRGIAGAKSFVLNIERQMTDVQKSVKAARREGGLKAIQNETAAVGKLKEMAQRVIDNKNFYERLDRAEQVHADLAKCPQRAHIAAELQTAKTSLPEARKLANDGDFVAADRELTTASNACLNGRTCADEYARVTELKASAGRLLASMKGQYANNNVWQQHSNNIDSAGTKAESPTRNYGDATIELNSSIRGMTQDMKNWWVTGEPSQLPTLQQKQVTLAAKSPDGTTVVDEDLRKVTEIRQKISDAVDAGKWPVAMLAATRELPDLLMAAIKTADRRIAYDRQREITDGDIQALATNKELLGQAFSLKKLVEKADQLASVREMRMEDGIAILKQSSGTCVALTRVYLDTKAYLEKRQTADEKLTELKTKTAVDAGMLDDQLSYIEKLLLEAQKATGIIDVKKAIVSGPNMEDHQAQQVDWALARTTVEQAIAAIAAADKLADNLADATGVAGDAENAGDASAVRKVVETLRKQAEQAASLDHADQAREELKSLTSSLDEALREVEAGPERLPAAQVLVQAAAGLLLGIRTIQTQYGQFLENFKSANDRQQALLTMVEPPADTVKSKTDASAKHLEQAQKQAKEKNWETAGDLLRNALAEISTAEELAKARKLFDARATRLTNDANSTTAPLKDQILEMIAKAKEKADAYNFTHANRFLDNAAARFASKKVKEKISSGQIDDEFREALDKMMSAVGGEENLARSTDNPTGPKAIKNGPALLDELVKNLGDDVPVKVIIEIAKKRFNIDLSVSALSRTIGGQLQEDKNAGPDAVEPGNLRGVSQRTKSAKKIYEMLALTPEQSKDNPSLKKVTRENVLSDDLTRVASGGYYQGSENLTSISGRPGNSMQKFGSKQKGYQKDRNGNLIRDERGKAIEVDQLPAQSGELAVFAPSNEDDVDYFDFANVHETGHAVDDRMRFMESRLGANQTAFGGWLVHGSDIATIAKQVVAKYGADYASVLEPYAADVIIGAKVEKPVVDPADQAAVNTACEDILKWFDLATKCKPWWSQPISEEITLSDGRVYQEAYPGTWVSYPLTERSKGITGYQFRAPGEWFAELYAAYHLDKLKPGHPARKWLSSLQL